MPAIDVNGTRLHVRIDGPEHRPVVMLSNSLASDLTMWDAQVPVLIEALRDHSEPPIVRGAAAEAVGAIGSQAASAIPDLIALLASEDWISYENALVALGKMGPTARHAPDHGTPCRHGEHPLSAGCEPLRGFSMILAFPEDRLYISIISFSLAMPTSSTRAIIVSTSSCT